MLPSDRQAAGVGNFCSYSENSFFGLCDPDLLRGIVAKNKLAHRIAECAVERANQDEERESLNEAEFERPPRLKRPVYGGEFFPKQKVLTARSILINLKECLARLNRRDAALCQRAREQ